MIIESLRDQDLKKLRKSVIVDYKYLRNMVCKCKKCKRNLKVNFLFWHPENYKRKNDAWKILELLEHFGYWGIGYDTVASRWLEFFTSSL